MTGISNLDSFVSSDIHRSNGFGREYVDTELGFGSDESLSLSDLREELDGIGLPVEQDILDSARTSPWLRSLLGKLAMPKEHGVFQYSHEGSYVISDQTFANILQIHNYRLAERSRDLRPQFRAILEDMQTQVQQLVEDGTLPKLVIDKLLTADIGFSVGDAENTHESFGLCVRSIDTEDKSFDVLVGSDAIYEGTVSKATVVHEIIHGIAKSSRAALVSLLKETLPDSRMSTDIILELEEAITEHVTQVILGDRDIEDAEVETMAEAYAQERAFLSRLKSLGISIKDLVLEYFDARENLAFPGYFKEALARDDSLIVYTSFNVKSTEEYDTQDAVFAAVFG